MPRKRGKIKNNDVGLRIQMWFSHSVVPNVYFWMSVYLIDLSLLWLFRASETYWVRSDISMHMCRWQPLSVHWRSHPAHNEWNEAWPQHRELHALLFTNSVWVLLRPTGLCEHWRVVRRGLRFIILIQEILKVLPFAGVITKAVLSTQCVLVRLKSNSLPPPPPWQPDAQPTEPPMRCEMSSSLKLKVFLFS